MTRVTDDWDDRKFFLSFLGLVDSELGKKNINLKFN